MATYETVGSPVNKKYFYVHVDKMTGRLSRSPLANKSVYTLKPEIIELSNQYALYLIVSVVSDFRLAMP